ncbi:MAG TPA: S8 family serine peptidase [Chitinophagaceae bacterium]|nr:S8 family serine peptidase [Chitinophagaceae bacterium]
MARKFLFFLLGLIGFVQSSKAQLTRYVIQLKNKGNSPYSLSKPAEFLSQRSIARRTLYAIPLDSTDLPVNPSYIESIRTSGAVTILNVSKGLNQVSIQTTDAAALAKINALPFVQTTNPIAARIKENGSTEKLKTGTGNGSNERINGTTANFFNYGSSFAQVHIHNGEFLHNIGLRGQDMIIGMLDAGFANYTSLKSFDSVRTAGQIIDTWDFVAREQSVVEDDAHGTACFSTIAANVPGEFVGTAPKAFFFLYRSEEAATEYPIEEHNWVCAAERVDSAGGDVISSSLGYSTFDNPIFNHLYADMNGNTTTAAKGADLAAKKGILVVNAAGNEGNATWHYISTPADGDSVLAVGAVNTSGVAASFSSYGPSADGQIKPDVASVGAGTIVQYSNNTIGPGNGTSFACPNMAGLATCLWQGFKEYNNIKIINALRQAGSIFTTPNDRIGFGIPDVKKALTSLVKEFSTASATINSCKTTINWSSKDVAAMKYEIERKAPGQTSFTKVSERYGTGNVFGNRNYQITDSLLNVQSGLVTYRIRQVIDTAAATFSADYIDTISIALSASCIATGLNPVNGNNSIQLVPNPAYNEVSLIIKENSSIQNLHIKIINKKGQVVVSEQHTKPIGAAIYTIPIAAFAAGKYTVLVYNGNKLVSTQELLKL